MRVSTEAIASDPSQIAGVPGKRGFVDMAASSAPACSPPSVSWPLAAGHLARLPRPIGPQLGRMALKPTPFGTRSIVTRASTFSP
jgi:hypothetical protein